MRMLSLLALLLCLGLTPLDAKPLKKRLVPVSARKALKQKYPRAKAKWEHAAETVGVYEANFKRKKVQMIADFDSTGQWLLSATRINLEAVPPEVMKALKLAEYSTWPLVRADKAQNPMYAELYRITYRRDKQEIAALVLPNGNMLRKTERKVD